MLHFPYFDLYRKQGVKQADLVLALLAGRRLLARGEDPELRYYKPITVRDSSLSASIQAVIAAEVAYFQLAYDYFAEAALLTWTTSTTTPATGCTLPRSAAP